MYQTTNCLKQSMLFIFHCYYQYESFVCVCVYYLLRILIHRIGISNDVTQMRKNCQLICIIHSKVQLCIYIYSIQHQLSIILFSFFSLNFFFYFKEKWYCSLRVYLFFSLLNNNTLFAQIYRAILAAIPFKKWNANEYDSTVCDRI